MTKLRCQIIARVEKRSSSDTALVTDLKGAPAAEAMAIGMPMPVAVEAGVTFTEIVLATASLDLDAARDGYNFVQLFSAGRHADEDDTRTVGEERTKAGIEQEEVTEELRPMGQLVLKLEWVEDGQEGGSEEAWGHTVLVVRGASGLAKPDS